MLGNCEKVECKYFWKLLAVSSVVRNSHKNPESEEFCASNPRYSPPFVDCNYMIASDDVADSDQNPLKCLF